MHLTPNNRDRSEEDWTDIEVPTTAATKFLGVIVDQNLNWEDHVDKLCKKLSSMLYIIRRIRNLTNEDTAVVAYHSLFHSHLRYGIAAWGSASSGNLNRILVIQKKTVRTILRLHHLEHCKPYFSKLEILTIISQYIFDTIIFAKKSQLITRSKIHTHNTRNRNNFNIPYHNLNKTSNTPTHKGSFFFNLLPQQLKDTTPINSFTKKLKKYLISRPYYNITEFINDHTYQHLH
jgi:hypothetical protein